MSVNKAILLGNLGKDPVVRKLDNGRAVAQFTIATNEKYKDRTGNMVTSTEWHNVVVWTPLAEIAEKYLRKGSQVYIEGKITTREYTDKDGQNRRTTEVVAREMTLVGSGNASSGGYGDVPPPSEPAYSGGGPSKSDVPDNIISAGGDDDLPF